jgi:hypothetical protein
VCPAAASARAAPPKTAISTTALSASFGNLAFGEAEDDLRDRPAAGLEPPVSERDESGELEPETNREHDALEGVH